MKAFIRGEYTGEIILRRQFEDAIVSIPAGNAASFRLICKWLILLGAASFVLSSKNDGLKFDGIKRSTRWLQK